VLITFTSENSYTKNKVIVEINKLTINDYTNNVQMCCGSENKNNLKTNKYH